MKYCSKCKTEKEDMDFSPNNNYCKPCKNQQVKDYQTRNRASVLEKLRIFNKKPHRKELNISLKRLSRYNLSKEEYNSMLLNQNFSCKICGIHQSSLKRSLAVDHDHKTGRVRGLLCLRCNTGLGHFRDNKGLLEKAIQYLKD